MLEEKNKEAAKLMKQKKYPEAAEILNHIIESNPSDPVGYINFANLLIQMNDSSAVRFLEKAIELDDSAIAAYYSLGNFYFKNENFKKAQANFETCIQKGMEDGDVYYMLALSLLNLEHGKLAIPYLMRAAELAPLDEDILFQYGLTLAKCNYIDESKRVFKNLLTLNPNHADAHYNLGIITTYYEELDEALAHFETAVKINPEHVLALNGLENVRHRLNQ